MNQIFPWKRFWCGRTGSLSLNDNGFFVDPELEHARYYHSDVKSFDEIQKIPCLILLGEPGSGKTTTLNSEMEKLTKQIATKKEVLFDRNLNEYGDESRLINEIFKSPVIDQWIKGRHQLYLFLDSLDECLLEIPKLAIIFRNQFGQLKNHINRLSLRISCRTGDWPETLTDAFTTLWGKENVAAYELAPLRRKDVIEAAKIAELDSSQFIKAIEEKEIQSLAGNPITLKFLLDEFNDNQQFPNDRSELFFRGCERLCTENNPDRLTPSKKYTLSPLRRLTLASRIAAVMVFCNKSSVVIKQDALNTDESALTLSMLQEGDETTGNYTFTFTENDLKETITQTALFTSRGPHLFGFAHQSYTEFLAARYLALHQLSIQQINSLIYLSSDPDRMVIPQLKETVAWFNTIMPETIKETIRTDPQTMLSGDIPSLESQFRRDLVESLLNQFEQMKIMDSDWGRYAQYQKLKHPRLAAQLKPYIEDKSKHRLVRRVAIEIAEACEVKEIQNLLADIALDKSDSIDIRAHASHAIFRIGDDNARIRLKPLALKPVMDDKSDRLKGNAFRALWPDHLSAKEVFNSLTPPKQEMYFGSYYIFLSKFAEQLKIEDLPHALKWVKKNPGERAPASNRYRKLADKILFRAWNHLDQPEILDAYAAAVIPRLENYLSISPSKQNLDDDQTIKELPDQTRKNLIKSIVQKTKKYRNYLFLSSIEQQPILFHDDLKWLIQELKAEKSRSKKKIWAEIIDDIYRMDIADHTDLILQEMATCKPLAEKFKPRFEPIAPDSQKAKKLRQQYEKILRWEKEHQQQEAEEKKKISPSVYKRIKSCVERFEAGDSNAWWQMCLEMTLKDTSTLYGDELNPDLQSLPGWTACDESLKKRVIDAAKKYILENDAATERWLGKENIYHRPAMAGYKAFVLLKKLDPSFLDNLSSDIWKKWAAVFIDFPDFNDADEKKPYLELLKKSYKEAPDETIEASLVLIDKENNSHDHIDIIRKFENLLDEKLQEALFQKSKDDSLKPGCFQDILSLLIKANNQKAIKYAKSLLTLPINKDEIIQKKAKAAALSLLTNAEDAGWDIIWSVIQADNDFGKKLFLSLPDSFRYLKTKSLPERISEHKIAELFIWLSRHFPKEEDPKRDGAGIVSSRESLANYRDNLLKILQNIGTPDAVSSLEYIKKEMPEIDSINFYLVNARENLRRQCWSPLFPGDFLLLTKNSLSRLVFNPEQLTDALMESLIRLEEKLQGETPNAIFLWNSSPRTKKLRPKSENDFSNFIKTHLSEDLKHRGIIALREVEIRRKQGKDGSPGELTDIYIAGYVPSSRKHVRVIIEVKGCWHKDVLTAMESQLLNRYLNESACNHGIYLVGWYFCNQWDGNDHRKKNKLSAMNIEEARKKFDDQAKKLSTDAKKIKACVLNCALR